MYADIPVRNLGSTSVLILTASFFEQLIKLLLGYLERLTSKNRARGPRADPKIANGNTSLIVAGWIWNQGFVGDTGHSGFGWTGKAFHGPALTPRAGIGHCITGGSSVGCVKRTAGFCHNGISALFSGVGALPTNTALRT